MLTEIKFRETQKRGEVLKPSSHASCARGNLSTTLKAVMNDGEECPGYEIRTLIFEGVLAHDIPYNQGL